MNQLELKLRKPGTDKVITKSYVGASKWNELTESDLIALAKASEYGLNIAKSKMLMAMKLYKIDYRSFMNLSHENKYHITKLCDFLFEKCELNKWIIKKLRIGFKTFHGPEDYLADLTGAEMAWLEAKYSDYQKDFKQDLIDEIIAILYRPKKLFAKKRMPFSEELAEETLLRVRLLPKAVKTAIFLNFKGCRNYIIDTHPIIYSGESSNNTKKNHSKSVWEPVLRKLAKTGVFGDYDSTKKQNFYTILAEVTDMIVDSQELQKKMKKA